MSQFKREIGIASRSENLIHRDCGGEVKIEQVEHGKVVPLENKGESSPCLIPERDYKFRLMTCQRCGYRETEEVT